MHWINSVGGHCKNGIGADEEIGMVPVIKIVAPNGRHVIHGGDDQMEILSAMTIENYDRRLQMVSPFKSTPRA
jgi:hypothetical protein